MRSNGRGGRTTLRALAALTLAAAGASAAQPAPPPAWQAAYDFLVPAVCIGPDGAIIIGASPLDAPASCPRRRKLALDERLPYRQRDWPGAGEPEARRDGYQQTNSFPIRTTLGLAVAQTWDFGDDVRAFDRFDPGDGGQIAFFSERSAAFGLTEDGGAGLQLFIGPGCTLLDAWIIVDRGFAAAPLGEVTARLTRRRDACPGRLGHAYTAWRVQPVAFRTRTRARSGTIHLDALVSEHYGGRSVAAADHLERFHFTRELGATRWERWQNLAVRDRAEDRVAARSLAESERCSPGIGPPGEGWVLVDCREWTQIVAPADPDGDPVGFWVDRLRRDRRTRALFAE